MSDTVEESAVQTMRIMMDKETEKKNIPVGQSISWLDMTRFSVHRCMPPNVIYEQQHLYGAEGHEVYFHNNT